MAVPGCKKTYDHRLRELVRKTGDLSVATDLGVPRSTAAEWLSSEPKDVVTVCVLDMREVELQAEVLRLRRRLLWSVRLRDREDKLRRDERNSNCSSIAHPAIALATADMRKP